MSTRNLPSWSSRFPKNMELRRDVGRFVFCLSLFVLSLPLAGYAQVNTGGIVGRVTDASGAVVAGAKVTLENTRTGVTAVVNSNETGSYVFGGLAPGTYTLTVTLPGFETHEETNIPVAVAETSTHDVQMKVGAATTSVTVSAPAIALRTTSAALGNVVEEQQVRDLPLNGRNFTELLTLTAGAASVGTAGSWGNPQSGTYILPSINGQNPQSTQWILDGANNTSNFAGGISVAPVVDDIAEFKVVSLADSTEYGGALGGYVNVVTKSGTNQVRGALWEFLRNNDFDARNPFLPNVSALHQNQFGGNAGGPIKKDRAFIFGSYQGLRDHIGQSVFYLVPTPAMEAGDFTGQLPIYNPYSTSPDASNPGSYLREPFQCDAGGNPIAPNANGTQTGGTACNKIPSQLMSPFALNYAKTLFPAPVNTGVPGTNGLDTSPEIFNQDFFSGRIDYQISNAHSLTLKYNNFNSPDTTSGGIVGSSFQRDSYGYSLGANYTYTITPTTVFHGTFSHEYVNLHLFSKWDNLNYDNFVYPNYPWACNRSAGYGSHACWAPMMQITGYGAVNNFNAHVGQTDVWETTASVDHVHGNHTIKAGFSLWNFRIWATTQRAFEYFGSNQTANLENPGTTGSAIASFFLGVPFGGELTDTAPGKNQPTWTYGFYAQDQWKISNKLTFNYGVRWDLFDPGKYGTPGTSNFYSGDMDMLRGLYVIPALPPACSVTGKAPCIPTPGGVLPAHVVVTPTMFRKVYDNWAPRLGLAYRLDDKTVLRAGAARFYDTMSDVSLGLTQSEGLWPDSKSIASTTLNETGVGPTIANPLNISSSSAFLPDPNGPFDISGRSWRDPRMKDPWTDQWTVGVERQFGGNTMLTVNYVGSNGRRIPIGGTYGSAVTPGPGDPTLREPFPYILPSPTARDWGRMWYNALQATLQHKFSSGFSYTLAYTWSKSQDLGATDGYAGNLQNPYDLSQEKEVGAANIPHMFTAGWVYELPFGKAGSRLSSGSRAVNAVIGGWQVNGLLQLTSGVPYGVVLCGDIANVGRTDCYERPNLVGNPKLSNPSTAQWFNLSAFAVPQQYTYGNAGANILTGDGFSNLDLSLFRNIQIRERTSLQFRFEAFNAFNTPTWGNPIGQLNLPGQTGVVTSTRSTQRELQLAMKLYF